MERIHPERLIHRTWKWWLRRWFSFSKGGILRFHLNLPWCCCSASMNGCTVCKKNQCLSFGRFWGRQKDACFFKDAIQPCFGLISPHIGGEWGSGSRFCHVKKDKDKYAKDKDRGKGDKEKGNRLENRFYSNKSCEQWTCNVFLKGTFGDFNYCGDHFINHGMRNPM